MRKNSDIITRITWARSGTSMPANLLHRKDVGEIVHDPAQVVDAVRVGDEGVPGLPLPHLLRAAVMEADLGQAVDDLLAVELQDDADDAVGAGMLGPDVEEHEVGALVGALHPPVLGPETQRLLLPVLALVGKLERTHLGGPAPGDPCAGGVPPR